MSATDCVEWVGGHLPTGYGFFKIGRRTVYVHRWVWEQLHGSIPEGLCVCHHCDNPPCWNPEHLFLGSKRDNTADMIAKGRQRNSRKTHCKHGHPFDEANTLWEDKPTGRRRQCRICVRAAARRNYHRRRAVV